jgi:hypothetical protein
MLVVTIRNHRCKGVDKFPVGEQRTYDKVVAHSTNSVVTSGSELCPKKTVLLSCSPLRLQPRHTALWEAYLDVLYDVLESRRLLHVQMTYGTVHF